MSSTSLRRHHVNSTQAFHSGIRFLVTFSPGMVRLKWKRFFLSVVAGVFFIALLRANWRSPGSPVTFSFGSLHKTEIEGFKDLAGSRRVLEPLVIHKVPANVPKEVEENVQETKVKEKTQETKSKGQIPDRTPDDVLAMTPPKLLPNYKNPCWREASGTGSRLRCLPYFHLIGVDKSGTTDLWFRLKNHPDILESTGVLGKETHWWSWRRFGFDIWTDKARIQHFEDYVSVFDKPATTIESTKESYRNMTDYHRLITGEGSPTVFWDMTGWDMIPQNKDKTVDTAFLTPHCIHHITPGVKLIVIFRNPTDRLYSDYLFLQLYRPRKEPLTAQTFHTDVLASIKMLQECQEGHSLKQCLYNKTLHMSIPVRLPVSFYAEYLKEWFKIFPRENILVLRNEDYSKDIRIHVEKTFNFLEMRKLPDQEIDRIANLTRAYTRNKAHKMAGDMLPETRKILDSFHSDLNTDLVKLLGDTKYSWTSNIDT